MIVLVVPELLAHEALGLTLIRRDEEGFGLDAEPQRRSLRVEHGRNLRRFRSRIASA